MALQQLLLSQPSQPLGRSWKPGLVLVSLGQWCSGHVYYWSV